MKIGSEITKKDKIYINDNNNNKQININDIKMMMRNDE